MAVEIERKFLVKDNTYRDLAFKSVSIRQGYLNRNPDRTVRVRTFDNKGYITVKGRNDGAARLEFEYEIPLKDAIDILELCERPVIEKTRYKVEFDSLIWEIDEYHGRLEGSVIAEIELPSEDYSFKSPAFVGTEVTGDPKYYNSNL